MEPGDRRPDIAGARSAKDGTHEEGDGEAQEDYQIAQTQVDEDRPKTNAAIKELDYTGFRLPASGCRLSARGPEARGIRTVVILELLLRGD